MLVINGKVTLAQIIKSLVWPGPVEKVGGLRPDIHGPCLARAGHEPNISKGGPCLDMPRAGPTWAMNTPTCMNHGVMLFAIGKKRL